MILTVALAIIFTSGCLAVLVVPTKYRKYVIFAVTITPFVLSIYFFENTQLYVILTLIYAVVMYIFNNKGDVLYYITGWKSSIPIGLAAGVIVAGAFYYIVSNNKNILLNNIVAYNKLVPQAGILDLLYISLIIVLIYIIGSWGILRRRAKYLNLLSRNKQYHDESEKKDG